MTLRHFRLLAEQIHVSLEAMVIRLEELSLLEIQVRLFLDIGWRV
ncbi:MAG: hypothetical protein N0E44_23320 [Candidatus Thiodiazotropha lotti]|nr:hypothetical protein [Candidatus Thiodiazotropha lotti]